MRTIGAIVGALLIIPQGGSVRWTGPPARAKSLGASGPGSLASHTMRARYSSAKKLFEAGDYSRAAALFESIPPGETGDLPASARWYAGNCYFALGRYQQALTIFLEVKDQFTQAREWMRRAMILGSIASVYFELGDAGSALAAAEEARRGLGQQAPARQSADLVLLEGAILARRGDLDAAIGRYQEAIRTAAGAGELRICANAWNGLGYELLLRGRLAEAEAAIEEGLRIRRRHGLPQVETSLRNLGLLRLEQGQGGAAMALLEEAVLRKGDRGGMPLWQYLHARGRARLAAGNRDGALADFRAAVDRIRNQRILSPSGDLLRIGIEGLVQAVYTSLAEAAVDSPHQQPLLREALEAIEENRGWSLYTRSLEREEWRRPLSPAYWELVERLRQAESGALDANAPARREMERLREQLLRLEVRAGSNRPQSYERINQVQEGLPPDAVLISFHLGERESLRWTVSRKAIVMHRLDARQEILPAAVRFRQAVERGDPEAHAIGAALYQALFGGLPKEARAAKRWLLSLDEGLLDAPLGALVTDGPAYLAERHALQVVSSASAFAHHAGRQLDYTGPFIGLGDAIYNTADPRWLPALGWRLGIARPRALQLARLAGSGPELRSSASAWQRMPVLLEGVRCRREALRNTLAYRPSVVHFATHVLRNPALPASALIGLSLTEGGDNEFLATAELPSWRMDASLVVISGCSSAAGHTAPATGRLGLIRAFLMAGAGGVIASQWPTPDDSGELFSRFYTRLRQDVLAGPAAALRSAQQQMIASRTWRAQPKYWSAYTYYGND